MKSGELLSKVAKELGITKSTLWSWKCKYAPMLAKKFNIKDENKPKQVEDLLILL